ncbi:hypothetical protein P3X46_028046 [Hevea brasiliensis]|uniref:Uncharacterized protein n=1 Tax=Hevea brasiliensis TaxID=3981 RepID=A0ABQ9KMS3_HEVBR|nr:hypothetical protein P3X46_028046 [Hevea brasiliensis]
MMINLKNSRKKPSYISEEIWENFEQYWNDPKVIRWSELYSRNHRGAVNVSGPSTHTGRSIKYIEWSDKLPPPTELFVYTHTRKHDKETFVDQKSKEIHNPLYLNVVEGGEKRRKVYGLRSESSTFYPLIGASSSRAFTLSSSPNAAL